jgi:hypothetical protein
MKERSLDRIGVRGDASRCVGQEDSAILAALRGSRRETVPQQPSKQVHECIAAASTIKRFLIRRCSRESSGSDESAVRGTMRILIS